jgi:predicted metal-dependent phosphoesterase TrpH
MGLVDLHVHSTASDGTFSPADIVKKAVASGVTHLAIADHDTVDGIAPAISAAGDFPGLTFIPAVELSTDIPQEEVHVLGYFIDYTDPDFAAALERFRASRIGRAMGMVEKLNKLGVDITWERVKEIAAGSSIGRPHIAQAMLEKGYITSLQQAFDNYIGRNGPAYVEREKITPAEAVKLILKAKGIPVLAHPLTIKDPEPIIAELKDAGLVGIEAYYKDYSGEERDKLLGFAAKYNLITTGGSDYHGLDQNTETAIGGAAVPVAAAEKLVALSKTNATGG